MICDRQECLWDLIEDCCENMNANYQCLGDTSVLNNSCEQSEIAGSRAEESTITRQIQSKLHNSICSQMKHKEQMLENNKNGIATSIGLIRSPLLRADPGGVFPKLRWYNLRKDFKYLQGYASHPKSALREPMWVRTRDMAVRHFSQYLRVTGTAIIRFALIFRWNVIILLQLENRDYRNEEDIPRMFSSLSVRATQSLWSIGSQSRSAKGVGRSTIPRSQMRSSWS
jgi:hypothetical protein